MTARVLHATLFILFIFAATSALAQSAQVKGTYDFDCSVYTFHLPAPHSSSSKNQLMLQLRWNGGLYPPAWESAGWVDITAKRCATNSAECEDATKAQIQFEQIENKRLVGGFTVDFANEHEEGKFRVKFHHTGGRLICE
jgi:hypothetical protein